MIWKTPLSLDALNARCEDNLAGHLGMRITAFDDQSITGRMPVDRRTKQPSGQLNGGASCALAESLGSCAGNYCVDQNTHYCVGLDINANHVRPAFDHYVEAVATPWHLGRRTQVWRIDIFDHEQRLICISRLTLAVIEHKNKQT